MGQRKATWDIAFSLVVALLVVGALAAYIFPRAMGPSAAPSLSGSSPVPSHDYARGDDARGVGSAFVQQLAMAHHEEAYKLMASAYRQTTTFSAFQKACMGSPLLSTARNVSFSRTSEAIAPGQDKGAISARGVMATGAGPVEVSFAFVDDGAGLGIIDVSVAGTPAFPMDTAP